MDLIFMLTGGFLNSSHCIGMCGPFVVTIGATDRSFSPMLLRQLVYSAGRIFTYGFLGAMAGLAGARLAAMDLPLVSAQRVVSIVAGVLLLAIGLSHLGVRRFRFGVKTDGSGCGYLGASLLKHFVHRTGFGASFLAGVFTGFLPCGLVYTFLLLAVRSGSVLDGWLGMMLFGLGTVPALTVLGCSSGVISHALRAKVFKLASCFVIILGIATLWRGLPSEEPCCDSTTHVSAAIAPATAPDQL